MSLWIGYKIHHWNDDSTEDKQPRILYRIKNIGYLVSAVYSCDNHHKIMAHDELVLRKLSSKILIPFVLFHRTALTRDLTDMVIALVRKRMNFYNIESLIFEQRWEYFSRQHLLSIFLMWHYLSYQVMIFCQKPS